MAKICCSIEMEPRTLNQGQLSHAREMAADVAQKMEPREASAIFIEGLISSIELDIKEVNIDHEEKELVGSSSSSNEKLNIEYNNQKTQMLIERACQCSCNNIDSPDLNIIEEPVTAPF